MTTTTATGNPQLTASTTRTDMQARTRGSAGTSGVVAGLLMVTGIGWNAGLEARPFHPALTGLAALATHVVPLILLMMFLVPALTRASRGRGVTVAAVLALAFGVFSAVFSITQPHAVMGIHNINDVLPIAILEVGALLWLVRGRRARRDA
jgi:uncharacterized membrane protein